ncbi:LptE family protein [Desulfococcus sp.]|uniref:LptE family protein n=1 Tax=Desulfococcus sp. TaxID=2025834 RepID=UPI0035935D1D
MFKDTVRHHPSRLAIAVCLAVLSTAAGCGYRFSTSGQIGNNITTVSVAMLENRTAETGVENIFTNDLIFEFTKNGNTIVEREAADAVLSGSIDAMPIETVAYQGQITSIERRITAFVTLKLIDRKGQVIWSAAALSQSEAYGILQEKVATDYNKREAIRILSKRLAEDAYSRITESF